MKITRGFGQWGHRRWRWFYFTRL